MITLIGYWLFGPAISRYCKRNSGQWDDSMRIRWLFEWYAFLWLTALSNIISTTGLACAGVSEGLSHGGCLVFSWDYENNTLNAPHVSIFYLLLFSTLRVLPDGSLSLFGK